MDTVENVTSGSNKAVSGCGKDCGKPERRVEKGAASLRERLNYWLALKKLGPEAADTLDIVFDVLAKNLKRGPDNLVIDRQYLSREQITGVLAEVTHEDVITVTRKIDARKGQIYDIAGYALAALYNAPGERPLRRDD